MDGEPQPTGTVMRQRAREDGAVAVIVALLLVVMVGLLAFSVDFGLAYDSKRELQNSADAAALAAAAELGELGATCSSYNGAQLAAAEAVGIQYMVANHPDAVAPMGIAVDCAFPGQTGKLTVTWVNEATTPGVFGGVYGGEDITTSRSASAAVAQGGGLRPLALCFNELPSVGSVGRVNFDGHNSDGGCDGLSGNWRSTDCPESDNNGTSDYITKIEQGCSDEVVPVLDPVVGVLRNHLVAACPPGNGDSNNVCLGGNTGQVFGGQIPDAWEGLLDRRFTLPVLCGPATCTPVAAIGSGNTGQYPIYRLADVTLCGVHRKNEAAAYGPAPECSTASSQAGDKKDNWLIIQLNEILGPGDPLDPALLGSVELVE